MALADIMLKIGKKIVESPNFGDAVKIIVSKCSDSIEASKQKKIAKEKAHREKIWRDWEITKKKYSDMKKFVLDYIKQGIKEHKYKISPETKEPVYDICLEASECIENSSDFNFFTAMYQGFNKPVYGNKPEDVQEISRWYKEYKQKQKEKKANAKKRLQTKNH